MVNEQELRREIAAYVAREISLASLERWLHSVHSQLVVDSNDAAFVLLASVNLLVSERHDNVISGDELRDEFASLLNNIREEIHTPSDHGSPD